MFQDNLKTLRKNKGYTQEELASRLKVVRQTVSKWEKGLSVPDAEMLQKIAEEFEQDNLLDAVYGDVHFVHTIAFFITYNSIWNFRGRRVCRMTLRLNKRMGCKSPRCRRCKCRGGLLLTKVSHWGKP